MMQLWKKYVELLNQYPLPVKTITSSIVAGSGSIIAQATAKSKAPFSLKNAFIFCMYGMCITGPLPHYFYTFLPKLIPDTATYSTVKRLLVERLLFAPTLVALYFYFTNTLKGLSPREVHSIAVKAVPGAIVANWKMWTPAQIVNLTVVPPIFRVLFANVVGFFWSIYLAQISS